MRRAKVKLAPNLGAARNRNIAPTPKVVIKSDTENSESETNPSDNEETKVAEKKPNIVENLCSQPSPVVNGTTDTDDHVPEPCELFKPVEITPVAKDATSAPTVESCVGDHGTVTNGHHSEPVTNTVNAAEVRSVPTRVRLPPARIKTNN